MWWTLQAEIKCRLPRECNPRKQRVLIPPCKSGVRCRLNIVFKGIRPNQTCKNNEQREMWNSRRWGDVCMISNQVRCTRQRASCVSSLFIYLETHRAQGLKVWGRMFLIHSSMSPMSSHRNSNLRISVQGDTFVTQSVVLQMECCGYSKGWFWSGTHRWVDETKFS